MRGSRTWIATAIAVMAVALLSGVLAGASAGAAGPAWIVFSAHPNGGIDLQLFRVQTTGNGLQQITKGGLPAVSPAFTPDGKRIVFSRLGSGLFSMNVNGSGLKRLTANGRDSYAAVSPDGKRIAFVRPFKTDWRLFTMPISGGAARLLAKSPPAGRPTWAKDGKSILIPAGGDLVRVDAKTGLPKSYYGVTLDIQVSQTAAVSPDGAKVVYIGPRISTGPEDCGEGRCPQYALYLANVKAPHKPKKLLADTGAAGWSPDGSKLAFVAQGPLRIWSVSTLKGPSIDTSPHTAVGDAPPAWQPR